MCFNDNFRIASVIAFDNANASDSKFYLSWWSSSDDVGVVEYDVYNGTTLVSIVGSYPTRLCLNGLGFQQAKSYIFSVVAKDSSGNTSTKIASQPIFFDLVPPSEAQNITLTPTGSAILLSWTPASDDCGGEIYYSLTNNADGSCIQSGYARNCLFDKLISNQVYSYKLKAEDVAGNWSTGVSINVYRDTIPPTTPATLTYTMLNPYEVSLSWQGSTDNFNLNEYNVFNGTTVAAIVNKSTTSCVIKMNPEVIHTISTSRLRTLKETTQAHQTFVQSRPNIIMTNMFMIR